MDFKFIILGIFDYKQFESIDLVQDRYRAGQCQHHLLHHLRAPRQAGKEPTAMPTTSTMTTRPTTQLPTTRTETGSHQQKFRYQTQKESKRQIPPQHLRAQKHQQPHTGQQGKYLYKKNSKQKDDKDISNTDSKSQHESDINDFKVDHSQKIISRHLMTSP